MLTAVSRENRKEGARGQQRPVQGEDHANMVQGSTSRIGYEKRKLWSLRAKKKGTKSARPEGGGEKEQVGFSDHILSASRAGKGQKGRRTHQIEQSGTVSFLAIGGHRWEIN